MQTDPPSGNDWLEGEPPDDPPWSFEEVQRFRQPWLWAVALGVSAFAVVTVVVQRPGPVLSALLLGLPAVGLPGTYLARLRTEAREDGLYITLWPLHRSPRRVAFADVTDHETIEIRPFRDYGGIGIRRTPGGWAYVVGAGGAVRLEREEAPSVVVGTERPEDLDRAVAAGVARAAAAVEGDRRPKWEAVADFQGGDDPPAEGPDADHDDGDGG